MLQPSPSGQNTVHVLDGSHVTTQEAVSSQRTVHVEPFLQSAEHENDEHVKLLVD